jgi:hypothetical protein
MEAEPSTVEPGPTEGSSQQEADSAVGSEQGSATSDAQGAKASGPPSSAAVTPVPAGVLGATGTVTEGPRVEVSAATVTRMMGIATAADLRLLEGRMDLLASKVTGLLTKVDRAYHPQVISADLRYRLVRLNRCCVSFLKSVIRQTRKSGKLSPKKLRRNRDVSFERESVRAPSSECHCTHEKVMRYGTTEKI